MSNAKPFDVGAIVADLNRTIEDTTAAIAIEVTAELQETTPVATGFARASWIPSIGAPSAEMGGSPEAPAPAAAEAGLASIARFRLADGKVFIGNNTRYIRELDRGSSRQAPAGFVRASVERGLARASAALGSSSTLSGLRARVVGGA